jgi:hypothetical protein
MLKEHTSWVLPEEINTSLYTNQPSGAFTLDIKSSVQ